jgi:hypothetical protein
MDDSTRINGKLAVHFSFGHPAANLSRRWGKPRSEIRNPKNRFVDVCIGNPSSGEHSTPNLQGNPLAPEGNFKKTNSQGISATFKIGG